MYKYVLNSVAKISLMFAQYFEYYGIILRGGVFSWTHCTCITSALQFYHKTVHLTVGIVL